MLRRSTATAICVPATFAILVLLASGCGELEQEPGQAEQEVGSDLAAIKAQIARREEELSRVNADIEANEAKLDENAQRRADIESELSEIAARKGENDAEIARLLAEKTSNDAEIARLQAEDAALTQELAGTDARLLEIDEEMARIEARPKSGFAGAVESFSQVDPQRLRSDPEFAELNGACSGAYSGEASGSVEDRCLFQVHLVLELPPFPREQFVRCLDSQQSVMAEWERCLKASWLQAEQVALREIEEKVARLKAGKAGQERSWREDLSPVLVSPYVSEVPSDEAGGTEARADLGMVGAIQSYFHADERELRAHPEFPDLYRACSSAYSRERLDHLEDQCLFQVHLVLELPSVQREQFLRCIDGRQKAMAEWQQCLKTSWGEADRDSSGEGEAPRPDARSAPQETESASSSTYYELTF